MSVDLERRHDLPVNIDITFPVVPCAVLSIDALDISGTSENDASHAKGMDLHKIRLDPQGKRIGKVEYLTPQSQHVVEDGLGGAMMNVNVPQAMKHLVEMEDEAEHHEGCRLTGTMLVKRVAGRIHISVHQQMVFQLLPQLLGGHHVPKILNMSHHVHSLSFGPHYPGRINPLDGFHRMVTGDFKSFKYFIKVVPTEYYGRLGGVTETQQYSVSEYSQVITNDGNMAAAVDFMYDVSPIVVTVNDSPPSILHFVVRMCAVIGGVFAVTRMTDRWVHWLVGLVSGS
eukprot:CAMPEP_0202900984 /NCGR_PEP_ID=MMETSP1392-20130828/12586_1 /ASSEMBLY_ACC=CAM_ASM_000868 /TAXON_ID=225041 /ORGANISM="Chlamydomonas chlamydogama, Strain SAG 11-48b" /LENGTH=284 /DNA_ID=CAMNT_0049587463 /DNA_START=274 /DNA_END=1131 /DNA_ORIENTATION=+